MPSTALARRAPAARRAALLAVTAALASLSTLTACGEGRAAPGDSALAHDLAMARGDSVPRDLTRADAQGDAPELRDVALGAASSAPAARRPTTALPAGSSVDRVRPDAAPRRTTPPAPAPATNAATTAPVGGGSATGPTPAPSPAPTPAPAAATASGATTGSGAGLAPGTVAAGATLVLSPHIRVCSSVNSVGDVFEATLTAPVTGTDGATIPSGANAVLKVTDLTRSGDDAVLSFEIVAIGVTRRSFAVSPADAGGAAAGSARTSNEIEAGAGKATAQEVARFGTCVPRNGELRVTLTRGVRLTASGA